MKRGIKGLGSSTAEHFKRAEAYLDDAATYSVDYRAAAAQGKCAAAFRHMSNLERATAQYLTSFHSMSRSAQLKLARQNKDTISHLEGTWGGLDKFERACLVKGPALADFKVTPLSSPKVALSPLSGIRRKRKTPKRKARR